MRAFTHTNINSKDYLQMQEEMFDAEIYSLIGD